MFEEQWGFGSREGSMPSEELGFTLALEIGRQGLGFEVGFPL